MEIEHQIAALKAEIPETELQEFEAHYQERLAAALQAAHLDDASPLGSDTEQVEARLIDDLIREAEGRDNPDGLGFVPAETLRYYIPVPERDPRTETRSRTGSGGTASASGDMTPGRWAAVVGLLLVALMALAWPFLGTSTSADAAASASPAPERATRVPEATPPPIMPTTLGELGGAGDLTVADPTSLEIRRSDGGSLIVRVIPIGSELGGSWTPTIGDDQAAWLSGTVINSVFCLPNSAASALADLKRGSPIVMRPASGALRRYEVMRVRQVGRQQVEVLDQRRAGMTLLRCDEDGATRTVVEAVYRPDTVQRPTHAVGTNTALADLARVQVQRVTVITPTAELPPGLSMVQLTVEVTNLTNAELPWTDLADQLETFGSVAETVASVPQAPLGPKETRRVGFRYRVPSAGGDARWRMTAPTGESVTVRVVIPAAPRVSRIHVTLRSEDVRRLGTGDQARIQITATITNTGAEPISVDNNAVGVWQGATALPLQDESTPLPLVIDRTTPTTITLVVDDPGTAALTVQIGTQRWRLQIP